MSNRIHCAECYRPKNHCYCEHIIKRENTFPVKLLQSVKESKHPFNTGRIAKLSLSNCDIHVSSSIDDVDEWLNSFIHLKPVVAFPAFDAKPVSETSLSQTRPVIFIDDTWRKAKRFLYESPTLNALPKIALPHGHVSMYELRTANKHRNSSEFNNSPPKCTIESIVECLNALEKRSADYTPVLNCLEWIKQKQQRTTPKK